MTKAKGAPRRAVLEIDRVGDWGEVTYRHRLACGHVEVRKRPSPAKVIACSGCVHAAAFAERALPAVVEAPEGDWDEFASAEYEAQVVAAGLAWRLGVEAEFVSVASGPEGVRHAVVVLDREAIARLLG